MQPFFRRRHTDGGWQNTRCLPPSPSPLSLFLSPCLPQSFLPSLAGGDSEPAYKLRLAEDPAPSLFSTPLPSRRRKGTGPHSKVESRSCSTSPSLPLSLLLSLRRSLPVPPFLPCTRRQGTRPQIKVRRKSCSLLLSLPPPSLLCRRRQTTSPHTLVERRSRAEETPWKGDEAVVLLKAPCLWHKLDSNTKISRQSRTPLNAFSLSRILICKYNPRNKFINYIVLANTQMFTCIHVLASLYVHKLVGQPVCTQTCWPACMYTNLLASLYVHKLVGQPVCTQTCWPACMYTNLLASLYVHKLVGQPVCTQTCWPACMYTNLLASLYVHKRVGQPVCTQTCWPACMYTNLLASLYVHKLVGQPVCTQTCWPACMYTNLLASLYVHKLVGQPVCTQTCWPACMYTNLLASLYVHTTIHLGPGHLFTGVSLFGHAQSVLW